MVCLGLKPRATEWKAQMNPLSYFTPTQSLSFVVILFGKTKVFSIQGCYIADNGIITFMCNLY